MVDIVTAAEELGYLVRSVGVEEIALTCPYKRSFTDVTISGRLINGQTLRDVLVPVRPDDAAK